jgi:hypothetical protein
METAEMRILGAVSVYKMTDHKRNEDIREELRMAVITTIIKSFQNKWLEHLE